MEKNKKGWIKIVEAFTSVLLIAGVLLIILSEVTTTEDVSQQIYDREYAILREIQLDNDLRKSVLDLDIASENKDAPADVQLIIDLRKPGFLDCEAIVCSIEDNCILNSAPENKDLFVQSSMISSNSEKYSPRQIKLFCWRL